LSGALVADFGIGPESWLILSLISCVTVFFKFSRLWSIRNLDLLLLFVLAPGLMQLIGRGEHPPWGPFVWLFVGSTFWLVRCLVDLGLTRRPLLEPNLNAAGLACLSVGILGLVIAEAVSLPAGEEAARNPADPRSSHAADPAPAPPGSIGQDAPVNRVLRQAPLPSPLVGKPAPVVLLRVLACLAHLGLVAGLLAVGWRHFERPISGLAVASCYLLVPYTRIALVDTGQLLPAALIVAAVFAYRRPAVSGALIGLAAGWMPACLGLIPLWAGFYRGRGIGRFLLTTLTCVVVCGLLAYVFDDLAVWARALRARSLAEVGLLPGIESPSSGSFWTGIDPVYRLPVQIGYLAFVLVVSVWPAEKNLGELISLSAALLVASQFWYLEAGGTLVLLYLPLILLMMFRPNLASKRPRLRPRAERVQRGAFVAGG
jgi:hypothetical protein